ncbi:MAG: ATP-dependent Clp protease ATP-binding subunit, partial [Chloroflexota bacterium]|nr:ATP-dependent Clp protease ATP-binding subunit [Chloroflexota bacterium]
MVDKFSRLTRKAREALALAQEEARRLNHNYVGTEHLLLGLVREEDSVASEVLRDLGLEPHLVQRSVERNVGRGRRTYSGELRPSPRTKRVIELAVDEARRLGHRYIGTEHLLLGLVREGEGMAVDILRGLGIGPDEVRRRTKQAMQQSPTRYQRKRRARTPTIDQLALDLTAEAEEGKLDPVIGREEEIERVIQILSRRKKNNPALLGDPGVGKTAIVEGLAQRIVDGDVPKPFLGRRLLALDVGSLVAGTIYRGQFEARLKQVIKEIRKSESILFVDEMHMLVGAGAAGSSVDAANILKPALSRGEIQCIGATTVEEYRKYIESDRALERRFQPIYVEEPTIEETVSILQGVRGLYEEHHELHITDEAIRAAAYLGARYISDRYLPDKAIDLVDEAASRVRMYKAPQMPHLQETCAELQSVRRQKEGAFEAQQYELASELRGQEKKIEGRLEWLRTSQNRAVEGPEVTPDDIAEVVSTWTGIPVARIATEESERLIKMEEALHKRIVGQDEAINCLARAIRRARAGLKDLKRPIGSFIFLGPTGVGKTELAKALAEFMFGSEEAMVKLDMSEFMERHTVSRLVGAPPGYVGYEEEGQLTGALRRRPYSLILLDEIEKAHPDAFNMLLQIMEDGCLSDARGRRVDFRNAILIMTSNVGARLIGREARMGFIPPGDEAKSREE